MAVPTTDQTPWTVATSSLCLTTTTTTSIAQQSLRALLQQEQDETRFVTTRLQESSILFPKGWSYSYGIVSMRVRGGGGDYEDEDGRSDDDHDHGTSYNDAGSSNSSSDDDEEVKDEIDVDDANEVESEEERRNELEQDGDDRDNLPFVYGSASRLDQNVVFIQTGDASTGGEEVIDQGDPGDELNAVTSSGLEIVTKNHEAGDSAALLDEKQERHQKGKVKKRKTAKKKNNVGLEDTEDESLSLSASQQGTGSAPLENGSATGQETNAPSSSSARQRQSLPPPSPNPIIRFFLRRGQMGRFLVTNSILWNAWCQLYVPTVGHFLTWLWVHFAPKQFHQASRDTATMARRRDGSLPRNKTKTRPPSRKEVKAQEKAQTRKADQQALKQLKRLGSGVQQIKYKHVTNQFLQRHGLGTYAVAATALDESGRTVSMDSVISQAMATATATIPEPKPKVEAVYMVEEAQDSDDEEEADDVEHGWVVEALTQDAATPFTSVKPSVGVSVGSAGPSLSLGFEFSLGGSKKVGDKNRDLKRKKKKVRIGPRPSDRDGGSGLVGRIRAAAATGSNSVMSRRVLGAYPGDAVPIQEAASADGVLALAQRYGWGDWSDDDDDGDDDTGGSLSRTTKTKKRSSRRRRRTPSSEDAEDDGKKMSLNFRFGPEEFDAFGLSDARSASRRTIKRRPREAQRTHEPDSAGSKILDRIFNASQQSPEPFSPRILSLPNSNADLRSGGTPLRSSTSELNVARSKAANERNESGNRADITPIRPAMASLNEARTEAANDRKDAARRASVTPIRPAMSVLNEAQTRAAKDRNGGDHPCITPIRPATSVLNEARTRAATKRKVTGDRSSVTPIRSTMSALNEAQKRTAADNSKEDD